MAQRRYGRDEMTPVEQITARTRQGNTDFWGPSRRECWEAHSVNAAGERDGMWVYQRLEMPGTPWEIGHAATGMGLPYEMWSTLDDARHDTLTRPSELLAKIRAHAQHVAGGEGFLPGARTRARAALPVLDALIVKVSAVAAR